MGQSEEFAAESAKSDRLRGRRWHEHARGRAWYGPLRPLRSMALKPWIKIELPSRLRLPKRELKYHALPRACMLAGLP